MVSIKNLIHYHDNLGILNKITDENLKAMVKESVDSIIEETVTNIVNKKVEEILANFVIPEHTHNYNDLENKPVIPNIEDLATKKDLDCKVDKVEGMGLSQNNFTNEEREKLINLENYDDSELNKSLNELSVAVKGMEGNQGEVNLEGLATIDYVKECLGEKKLVYLTEAEYEALSDEEKNKDGVVYNIIQE